MNRNPARVDLRRFLDFSPTGRGRVWLWTVAGTLGCVLIAIAVVSLTHRMSSAEELRAARLNALLIPLILAVPLLYFLTSKLRQLAIVQGELLRLAATDSLTRVLNRGAFTMLVDAYLGQVNLSPMRGALLVIDADNFKSINDLRGHKAGDEALRTIAREISETLQNTDLVGRMGGEEFSVFLPEADLPRASGVAENIRRRIFEASFTVQNVSLRLSVSVGGATFAGRSTFDALFEEADRQMYLAKNAGRNRVRFDGWRSSLEMSAPP